MTRVSDTAPFAEAVARAGGLPFLALALSRKAETEKLLKDTRDLAAGHPAAFTIDGPRGPARVAQSGAVFLAGATGHPILPFHIEADRFWTMNSWDRTQVPKPFSPVTIAIGEPIHVSGTEEATIEARRRDLERSLASLEQTMNRKL